MMMNAVSSRRPISFGVGLRQIRAPCAQRPAFVVKASQKKEEEPSAAFKLPLNVLRAAAVSTVALTAFSMAFADPAMAAKSSGRMGGSGGFSAARSARSYSTAPSMATRQGSTSSASSSASSSSYSSGSAAGRGDQGVSYGRRPSSSSSFASSSGSGPGLPYSDFSVYNYLASLASPPPASTPFWASTPSHPLYPFTPSSLRSHPLSAAAGARTGGTTVVHHHHHSPGVSTMPFFFFPSWGMGGWGYGYGGGFGGFGTTLMLVVVAFVAFGLLQNLLGGGKNDGGGSGGFFGGGSAVTVTKLQVGLLGSARGLQRELERIAGRADTSDSDGLHFVLQETVMALLRNPELAVYGFSETKGADDLAEGEEAFNSFSMEERSKFKAETFVNYGGRTRKAEVSSGSGDAPNELIVITILCACEGGSSLPPIRSIEDLKKALRVLGGVPASDVLAVEVLWAPQAEGDTMTRDELVTDYPNMVNL